jgi:hypothetical protein
MPLCDKLTVSARPKRCFLTFKTTIQKQRTKIRTLFNMGDSGANASTDVAWIAAAAFEWLQHGGAIQPTTKPKPLTFPHAVLVPTPHLPTVTYAILVAYSVPLELYDALYAYLQARADTITATSRPVEEASHAQRERRRFEFSRPFLGGDTVVTQLHDWIFFRMGKYVTSPNIYPGWSISLVQSSGFGKSRLLRELANTTKQGPNGQMKVLYMCLRPDSVWPTLRIRKRLCTCATISFRPWIPATVTRGLRFSNKS